MNDKIKWNSKEIKKGIVKIEADSFSRIPSIKEYKEYIMQLLGINASKEQLLDESYSPGIAENQLLYHETNVHNVIFSGPNGDISVNINNIEEVFEELESGKKVSNPIINPKNIESIDAAIEEAFERA